MVPLPHLSFILCSYQHKCKSKAIKYLIYIFQNAMFCAFSLSFLRFLFFAFCFCYIPSVCVCDCEMKTWVQKRKGFSLRTEAKHHDFFPVFDTPKPVLLKSKNRRQKVVKYWFSTCIDIHNKTPLRFCSQVFGIWNYRTRIINVNFSFFFNILFISTDIHFKFIKYTMRVVTSKILFVHVVEFHNVFAGIFFCSNISFHIPFALYYAHVHGAIFIFLIRFRVYRFCFTFSFSWLSNYKAWNVYSILVAHEYLLFSMQVNTFLTNRDVNKWI